MCARLLPSRLPTGSSGSASATASTGAGTRRVPLSVLAAPALASDAQLSGLPPMMVVAGAKELLFPDIVRFVQRVRTAQGAAMLGDEGEDRACGGEGARAERGVEKEGETKGELAAVDTSTGASSEMYHHHHHHQQQQQQQHQQQHHHHHHRGSVHSLHSVDSFSLSSSVGPWDGDGDEGVEHQVELLVGENDVHVYPVLWRSMLQRVLCPLGLLPVYLHSRAWLIDAVTPRSSLAVAVTADAIRDRDGE